MYIYPELVLLAFDHLKTGKKDHTSLDSRQFHLAAPLLAESLSGFFTAVLHHGFLPDQLKEYVLVPIPYARKNLTLSDNHWPIALSSLLSKVLEWYLLIQFTPLFVCSGLQFGFKEEMSTSLCTGMLKNVVS